MRPGTLLWLLRHEVRVRWREALGDTSAATAVLVGVGIFLVAHLFLWQVVSPLQGALTSPLPPEAVFFAALLLLVLVPFGLTVGVNHSVMAMFERGDLDLLVSSPVSTRTVFASRVLGVAAGVFVTLGVFVVPVATLGLMLGLPQLLGALPLLVAVSLTCASLGMLVTIALVRALGPRRARTTSQVLATVAGASLFLLSQAPNMLGRGDDMSDRVQRWLRYFEPGGPLAADSLLWLPARTLFLDPLSTVVTLAASALVAWGAIAFLHGAFARGIGVVEGRARRARRRDAGDLRFSRRGGAVRVLLLKEWKLILRDPYLISQTLLQVLYLLPAVYILFVSDTAVFADVPLAPMMLVLLVTLGGTLAATVARICVAGEEAPDLLAASPLPGRVVRRAKLLAALVPVWALCLPLVVGIGILDPLAGVVGAFGAAAATYSVAMVRLWNPARASRKDLFRQRRVQGDPVLGVVEGFTPLAWAAACYMLATLNPWAVVPLALAAGLPAVGLLRARSKGLAFGA